MVEPFARQKFIKFIAMNYKIILRRTKIIIRFFIIPIRNIINTFWDARFDSKISVKEKGKEVFKIYDFGKITRMRGYTFEKKEPETLSWIKSFSPKDNFLDIGANIGIYSLYAARKGFNVISIEPDALNFALLNLNIKLNNFGNKITPYSIAIHNENKVSKLNIASFEWGALNAFDTNIDFKGNKFIPQHSQGVYGCSLDSFLRNFSFIPNHLKIDVDGNENLILSGAKDLLKNKELKSILIELDTNREDYKNSIKLIEEGGFKLKEKTHEKEFYEGNFASIYNHIFVR